MPIQNYYLRGNHRDTFRLVPVGNDDPSNFIHIPTPVSGFASFQADTQNYYVYARPAYTSEFTLLDSFVSDDYLYLRLLNPSITSDGVVVLSLSAISLNLDFTSTNENLPYIQDAEVVTIKVSAFSGTAPADGLQSDPTLKLYKIVDSDSDVYIEDATYDNSAYDTANPHVYWFTYTFSSATTNDNDYYFIAEAPIENVSSLSGVEAYQLHVDYTAPVLTTSAGVFISSPAAGSGQVGETPTEAVFLGLPSSSISDSGSGPKTFHLQPYIQNAFETDGLVYDGTEVNDDYQFADTNLTTWAPAEIDNYYITLDPDNGGSVYDGNEIEGTIVSYTAGVFVIALDSAPANGTYSYRIYKSPYHVIGTQDYLTQSDWPIQISAGNNIPQNVLLTAGLQSGFVVDLTDIEYGFIISGSDKALNTASTYSDYLYPSIVYDTIAEVAPAVSTWFAKDNLDDTYTQIFTNENGWFNEAEFRIIAKAADFSGGQSTGFGVKISVDGDTWNTMDTTSFRIDWDESGADDASTFYIDPQYYREGNSVLYLRGYDGEGSLGQIHQIDYKWDKTLPTWTDRGSIGTLIGTQEIDACEEEDYYWDANALPPECITPYATGGFNKAFIRWDPNSPPADPVPTNEGNSSISHVKIYRTENSGADPFVWATAASDAIEVGTVPSTEGEFLDSSFNLNFDSALNPFLYWGSGVDFAGNEQTTPILLCPDDGITISPLVAADVSGALGITKTIVGDTVEIDFGVSVPLEALTLRTPAVLTDVQGLHNLEHAGGEYGDAYTKIETLTYRSQDFAVFYIQVSAISSVGGSVVELTETPTALGIEHLIGTLTKGSYIRFDTSEDHEGVAGKDFVEIAAISDQGTGGNTILTFTSLSAGLAAALDPNTSTATTFEFGLILEINTTYSFAFPTIQNTYKWHVQFNENIDSEFVADAVHLSSILAADLIVGGELRLETGLSIWSGDYVNGEKTGKGLTLDKMGLTMFDGEIDTVNIDATSGEFQFGHGLNKLTFEDGSLNLFGNFHQIQTNAHFDGLTFTFLPGAWAENNIYAPGDIILYAGNYWVWINAVSFTSTYSPQAGDDWALYASFGIEGESAKSLSIVSDSQVFAHNEEGAITEPGAVKLICDASNITEDLYWRAVGYYEPEVLINASTITGTVQADLSIDILNTDLTDTTTYTKGVLPGDFVYIESDSVPYRIIESVVYTTTTSKIVVTSTSGLSSSADVDFEIKAASREIMLHTGLAGSEYNYNTPIANGSSVYVYASTFLSGENANAIHTGVFGPLVKVIVYLEQVVENIDSQIDEILYFDTSSIHKLIAGSSAYNIILSNETHLEYVNEYGTNGDWTNASTEIRLFKGITNIESHIEITNSTTFTDWTVTGPTANDGTQPSLSVDGDSITTTTNTAVYYIDVYSIENLDPATVTTWSKDPAVNAVTAEAFVGTTLFSITKIPEGLSNKEFKLTSTSPTWTLDPNSMNVMSPTLNNILSIDVSALTSNIDINTMTWALTTDITTYTHTVTDLENINNWPTTATLFVPESTDPPTYKVYLAGTGSLGSNNETLVLSVSVSGIDGTYSDTMTLNQLVSGSSGLTGWLSNESYAETAEYDLGDFLDPASAADGSFIIYRGENLVPTNTIVFETGAWYGRIWNSLVTFSNLTPTHLETLGDPDQTRTRLWSDFGDTTQISFSSGLPFFTLDPGNNFTSWFTTWIKVDSSFTLTNMEFSGDNRFRLYINNAIVADLDDYTNDDSYTYSFSTTSGFISPGEEGTGPWYKIDMLYGESTGSDHVRMGWNPSLRAEIIGGGGAVQGEINSDGDYTIHGLTAHSGVLPFKATVTNADASTSELLKNYTISRALEGEPGTFVKNLYFMASYTADLSTLFTDSGYSAFYPIPGAPQTLAEMLAVNTPWVESLPDMYSNLGLSVWNTSRVYRTDDTEVSGTVWSVPQIFLYQPTSVEKSFLKPLTGTAFLTAEDGTVTPAALIIVPTTISVESGEVVAGAHLEVWDAETTEANTITDVSGTREYTFAPADILGSQTFYLIDTNNGDAILDTISLVDISDGVSSPIGYVTVVSPTTGDPVLSFIQIVDQASGLYSWPAEATLTVTATMIVETVTTSITATITNTTGVLSVSAFTGDTGTITAASTATEGQLAMSFTHTEGFVVTETVYAVFAGVGGYTPPDGLPGSVTNYIFVRASTTPATPSGQLDPPGSYSEAAGLIAPNGWATTPDGAPGSAGYPLWMSNAFFTPPSPYETDTVWTYPGWVAPIQIEGVDGTNAKTITLETTGDVFIDDGNAGLTPDFIKFTVHKQNTSAAVAWTASPNVTMYTAATGGSTTNSANPMYLRKANYGANTSVVVTATCDGITDSTTILRLTEGSSAIQGILSNAAHVLPASSSGVIDNATGYVGSGTTIRVFEGSQALTFTTGTPAASQWAVSVGNTADITEGVAQASGTYCTVLPHSAAADGTDEYIIQYSITGKTANGGGFSTFILDQSLSKSKAGADGDNAGIIVIWNPSTGIPDDPTSTPALTDFIIAVADTNAGWWTASAGAVWMAITTYSDGSWSDWSKTKVVGADGPVGPGVVFQGEYDAAIIYQGTAVRRDLVKYSSSYWICILTTVAGTTPTVGINWQEFGATFSSVATSLLLTENAVITKELTIGQATDNDGRIISQGTDSSGDRYFILDKTGITATGGKIASFNIQEDSLTSDDGKLIIHTGTNPYIEIG